MIQIYAVRIGGWRRLVIKLKKIIVLDRQLLLFFLFEWLKSFTIYKGIFPSLFTTDHQKNGASWHQHERGMIVLDADTSQNNCGVGRLPSYCHWHFIYVGKRVVELSTQLSIFMEIGDMWVPFIFHDGFSLDFGLLQPFLFILGTLLSESLFDGDLPVSQLLLVLLHSVFDLVLISCVLYPEL